MDSHDHKAVLEAHVAECDDCRRTALPLDQLNATLAATPLAIDVATLSQRALRALQPELQRRAGAAAWRRVLVGVALSLLPLPVVVAYDAYFLTVVYNTVAVLLPAAFAAYLVFSYAALLVLLFALTYAAIPLLVVRDSGQQFSVSG